MGHPLTRILSLALLSLAAATADVRADTDFETCKTRLTGQAIAEGVPADLAHSVFDTVTYQSKVIELDRSQPEFVRTFPDYYSARVTEWRIQKGRELYKEHRALLENIYQQYGVAPQYLLAFWGLETNFGGYKGKMPVLSSLATLACDERRSRYFTQELMTAVKLLQRESLQPEDMVGSWAGAMGHTQFMPTAYSRYAVDGDGDGHVNLWNSEADALTSAAHFLSELGWQPGYRWGREVQLPQDFDYQYTGRNQRRPLADWSAMGITRANGATLGSDDIDSYVVVPASHKGPAFIAYPNFRVIMRWNASEFYAISVGELADQIAGAPGLVTPLPELPTYARKDILQMQEKLNAKGYDVGKPDGIIGSGTRAGIRQFQIDSGLIADGFPTLAVMDSLGVKREADATVTQK